MKDTEIDKSLGGHLIFLISQPRAGSTMLQRILGNHSSIHTSSEPWLMLHPLYALHNKGYEAEYGAHFASKALQDFLGTLPNGEHEYFEGVRQMCTHLYDQALLTSNRQYFLDKTPRYYFIVTELYRTFPRARYIILLRNPLAVLCSILASWVKTDWCQLARLKHDLTLAPSRLVKGIEQLGRNVLVVHYEHILENTESEIEKICEWIGVDFSSEIIEYGRYDPPAWDFGDQTAIHKSIRPVLNHHDKWVASLSDPQIWRIANEYFRLLGNNVFSQMGYSSDEIEEILEKNQPPIHKHLLTVSLSWLMRKPPNKRKQWELAVLRFFNFLMRNNKST